MSDPEVIADRERYAEVGRAYRQLQAPAELARQWRGGHRRRGRGRGAARPGRRRRRHAPGTAAGPRARRGARRGDPHRDGRTRPQRREERDRRNPGRGRRRGGRPVGRGPVPDADPLRRTPRLPGRGAWTSARASTRSRSRATAPTRCSSSRAAPTASSASRRPSPRGASTPPPPRSRSCPRPKTWTSRSTRPTCRSTCTAPRAPAGSRSTPPTRPCASPTSPAGSWSRCRTRSPSCRTASARMRVLRARLYERALAEQQAELAADRRSQVGTGDRAEKIRTYNYGERRVTDHRIKLTVHNLDQVLRRRPRRPHRGAAVRREAPAAAGPDGGMNAAAALRSRDRRAVRAGCEAPRLDAEVLLADSLGVPRARLHSEPELVARAGRARRLRGRRCGGARPSASRSPTSSAGAAFARSS